MKTNQSDAVRGATARVANRLIAESGRLTRLDQALGDGDHGVNIKRGCESVLDKMDAWSDKPPDEFLKAVGMTLLSSVGGAAGPLYATLITAFARAWPARTDAESFVSALEEAVAALTRRGNMAQGQKTMADVWLPLVEALKNDPDNWRRIAPDAARRGAESTIEMKALRGRASFLGDRSIGQMDPGAFSSSIIVEETCRFFDDAPSAL